jgi:hypothetical protein
MRVCVCCSGGCIRKTQQADLVLMFQHSRATLPAGTQPPATRAPCPGYIIALLSTPHYRTIPTQYRDSFHATEPARDPLFQIHQWSEPWRRSRIIRYRAGKPLAWSE